MNNRFQTVSRNTPLTAYNSVMRNTMILLGATFLFSSLTAYLAMIGNAGFIDPFLSFIIYFGLMTAIYTFQNSSIGVLLVFALTGFLGYTLGPILNLFINSSSNGAAIVSTAFFGTGSIFLGLSLYATYSGERMNYLAGFLTVASTTILVLSLLNFAFFKLPIMALVVSAGILLTSSGWILFELSNIVHGGQTNYVLATVAIFVQLYNIFLSLLQILRAFSGNSSRE